MEEDIKILEEYFNYGSYSRTMSGSEIQAVQNLIARYKELEKENLEIRDWKYVIDSYEDLDRLKELDVIKIKGKEYLAKSKVKDEISYLMQKYDLEEDYINYETVIEILQELIED